MDEAFRHGEMTPEHVLKIRKATTGIRKIEEIYENFLYFYAVKRKL